MGNYQPDNKPTDDSQSSAGQQFQQLGIDASRICVLLIDDQLLIAEAIRRALAPETDIEFHYCADPDLAVSKIEEVRPTCILQDLVMPDTDGLELLQSYRRGSVAAKIPVIVLSSRDEPETKSRAFSMGANDYLVKIPDRIELVARIRHHSNAYLSLCQRDAAFAALQESERQLALANAQLQELSSLDGLTGIANRRRFDEVLRQEWFRAMRHSSTISLIMLDIDYFKAYNDHYGHQQGDSCLQKIGGILQSTVQRESDLAARYGGEEFAIILPETNVHGACDVAEQIRSNIEQQAIPHPQSPVAPWVTVSLGVATAVPERSNDPRGLIVAADRALYLAKQDGRNRLKSFFEVIVY